MGKTCEKIRASWYFKNHVHWWLTCQGCSNNINCFCALTSMVLPWTMQTSCNILTETQSKHIWGRTRGGTWNGHMEEKSRRTETQMKFIDQVQPTHDLGSSLMVHQSSSHLQQLTTQVSSIIIKILPHRSVHATTRKLASLESFLDRCELSLSASYSRFHKYAESCFWKFCAPQQCHIRPAMSAKLGEVASSSPSCVNIGFIYNFWFICVIK